MADNQKLFYRNAVTTIRKPMTLVQASICNNGESVVLIADRLLTRQISESKYEFEWNTPKIFQYGDIGVGFAGVAYYAEVILSKINKDDFDKIINDVSDYVKELKQKLIREQTEQYTGLTPEEFFKNPNSVPDNIKEMVYGVVGQLNVETLALITGYDANKKSRIVVVDGTGNIYDMTSFGMASIGSGMQFSQMFFDMYEYDISLSETEGLFFAYRAKKWSEAPSGVGKKTDILIIRKNGNNTFIKNEDELMGMIDDAFKKEEDEIGTIRKDILKNLVQNSNGKLL